MGMQIENNNDFIDTHEAQGDRELKYYKDIYGNDVRLLTSNEKKVVNKGLAIASVFVVILLGGFFYRFYLVQKEIDERTRLYMMSGESLSDGKDIVDEGGVIVSEDTEIVDINEDGTIVAKTSGTTNVTIYKNIDEHDFSNVTSNKNRAEGEEIDLYDAYMELGVEGEITVEVVVKQVVTGVSLNMPSLDIYAGETNKLVANIFPYTAYNKDTVWVSSNNTIATVDSNGVVTARKPGTATITVTTKDGGFKDSTVVNVIERQSKNSIYINLDNKDFYIGETRNLITAISPNDELLKDVVYSSSDSSVATIDTKGKIKAKKSGKTTITARVASENISTSIDIFVKEKKLEKIYLSVDNLSLKKGDKTKIQAFFYPSDASSQITYTSSDSNVVSVNSKGEVTALKEGSAIITVKGENNISTSCKVTVDKDIVKANDIIISSLSDNVNVGSTINLSSIVKPDNATDKSVTYSSSDNSVAVVDSNGVVKGIKSGNVVISATNSSGITDSITIIVNDSNIAVKDISLPTNLKINAGKSMMINATISPNNASNTDITWSSSNENVLKVSDKGVITGIKSGSAVVTAKIGNISSTTKVVVNDVLVSGIDLNMTDVKMNISDEVILKATVLPSNVTDSDVVWSSSNVNVAKVDSEGKVSALKEGEVVIRATSKSNSNIYKECKISVAKIAVESFKVNKKQVLLTQDKTVKLEVSNISPSDATYKDVTYMISDNNIATVDNKGVITALKPGTTTVSINVDGVVKELKVTVFEKGDKVYFIDTYTITETPSDAILLESDGKYAMIDTGSQTSSIDIIDFLHDLGVKKLEFVLITHFHSESFGGVYGEIESDNLLLSDIKIGKLYMKEYSASDSLFRDSSGNVIKNSNDIIARRELRTTMFLAIRENAIQKNIPYVPIDSSFKRLTFGNMDLSFYNTTERLKNYSSKCLKSYNCSENSNSIVTYLEVNDKSVYLSGDIYNAYNNEDTKYLSNKTEVSIANEVIKEHEKIDVYKASDYGLSSSNLNDALKKIKPKYSVITNSASYFDETNSKGIDRIDKNTENDIYYSGDGTLILNINSKGNINFTQLGN